MSIQDFAMQLLGQQGQRGQGRDGAGRALAARLQQAQAPSGPLPGPGSVWAHALTQGLNGFRGGMMDRDIDDRADEREDRRRKNALEFEEQRRSADQTNMASLGFGAAPPRVIDGEVSGAMAGNPAQQPGMTMQPAAMQPAVMRTPMVPMPGEGGGMAASEARYASVPGRPALGSSYREPAWAAGLAPANGRMNADIGGGAMPASAPQSAPSAAPGMPAITPQLVAQLAALAGQGNRQAAAMLPVMQQQLARTEMLQFRREDREDRQGEAAALLASRSGQGATFAPVPREEAAALGLPTTGAFQRNSQTGQISQIGGGGVSVDARQMGTIPPGFRAEYDEAGRIAQLVPIPGGPASLDADKTAAAAASRRAGTERTGNIVLQDIGRAIARFDGATLPVAGPGAAAMGLMAGTGATDVRALLDSVKANVGFAQLNQMRSESPTGAALGAVTERELSLLQSVLGSLDQSQSPTQFRQNLVRLQQVYGGIVNGPAASATGAQPAASQGAQIGNTGMTAEPPAPGQATTRFIDYDAQGRRVAR